MPAPPRGVRFQRWGRCPHRPAGYVFSVGGDALIAPWGTLTERSEKTDTPIPSASGPMWASAPTKNNVRFQRWGRYPQKQRVFSALGAMPTKTTCVFSVGGDALIAPWGTSPERSEKTDMAVPLATGRCGHRPLQKTMCVFSVGGDALIAPWGTSPERSEKTNTPVPSASGPMWASAPTVKLRVSPALGAMPSSPRGVCRLSGWKRRTRPYRRLPGRCGASAPTKNNVRFQRRGRCPHRPAGYRRLSGRKRRTRLYRQPRADVGIGPYKI